MVGKSEKKQYRISLTLTPEEYAELDRYKRKVHLKMDATAIKQLCWKALESEDIISVET